MVIYLTGATGLAGSAIAEAACRRGHRVIGVGFRSEHPPPGLAKFLRLDLSDEHEVFESVLDHFPDTIVNAAAVSEPIRCEQDPEGSARLNIGLPAILARLSHHLSARLLHLSTDMVFDGKQRHYSPDSPTAPTSVYGHQKRDAEQEVLRAAGEFATVVRTTLLTGNSPTGRRSVHEKLFESWASGQTARLFSDELRQPCHAENLAAAVVEICERNDLFGTFHWAGAEEISRYEIGRRVLQHFKLPPELVEETSLNQDPRFAGRPANLTLNISALAGKLKTAPSGFDAQVETFKVPPPFREWYHSV